MTLPDVDRSDASFVQDCEDGETRVCGVQGGECRRGVNRCIQGLWNEACEGEVAPTDEACNGLDDDCDESVDEGLGLGAPCKTRDERNLPEDGAIECDDDGRVWCAPVPDCDSDQDADGFNICQDCDDEDRTSNPEADERCDGVDNDCDERFDEGFVLGELCYVGFGVCARGGNFVCNEFGDDVACDTDPLPPEGPELCGDEEDNDCDGSTDEGLPLGDVCVVGEGACQVEGVMQCTGDRTGVECDVVPGPPSAEMCGDAIDNDCDGLVDEGFDDIGEACVDGEGECRAEGFWRCSADAMRRACVGEGGEAIGELCGNQRDDDCDGEIDEAFDIGVPCAAGVGGCERAGVRVCAPEGDGTVCSAQPGPPVDERCGDMVDQDCDGRVDEGFDVGIPCAGGVGMCERFGVTRCAPGGAGTACDVQPGPPAREVCDTLDQDCDGRVDEGFDLGAPCEDGIGLCRRAGALVCDFDGGTVCDAIAARPELELCDEVDNDCDEAVDEDFELGAACDSPDDADLCERGVWACDADGEDRVCANDEPVFELCNNRDDDCDGVVDNGIDLFTDPLNCGNCGFVCPGPTAQCIDAACFRTYFVDANNGSNANGDGTVDNPWRTISHAFANLLRPRAQVSVAAGRYASDMHATENESFPLRLLDTVRLVGIGDPGTVIIDGRRGGTQIAVRDAASEANLIENLVIENAGGQFDAAITALNSTLVIRDVHVRGARTPNGWGVLGVDASNIVTHGLTVTGCNGTGGADGLLRIANSTLLLDACHFAANQAGDEESTAGIVWGLDSDITVTNCTFVDNTGNALYHGPGNTMEVVHNTFVSQSANGLIIVDADTLTLANNVFALNGRHGVLESLSGGGDIRLLANNVFWENGTGDYYDREQRRVLNGADQVNGLDNARGNVTADPSFISLPARNLRLREGSGCVDVGDPDHSLPVDQDDRARPRGALPDAGAFESFFEP